MDSPIFDGAPFVLLAEDCGGGGGVAFGRAEETRFAMLRRTIHAEEGLSFK